MTPVEASWPEVPRLVVAGLSGDAGKTLVSLGLVLAWRERGVEVQAFKKGPDYIDAAWLSWASGRPARNLDTWLAGFDAVRDQFHRHATRDGVNLIEGNRGVFDGVDAEGTHSTAQLARAASAPVILVVDARKVTRTAAALVLGCRAFDPALDIAGVVLNRVAGARHEAVTRAAVESATGVPVVGAIPRIDRDDLPGRHLGLVTPAEHESPGKVREFASELVVGHLDVDRVLEIARRVSARTDDNGGAEDRAAEPDRKPPSVVIGCLRDPAFSFYYPDNLEALAQAGASLVSISSLEDPSLPPGLDALYIGGGFPEIHASRLAANRCLLASVQRAAIAGLPIYAECGGLMLLSRAISVGGQRHEMAGVLPLDVDVCDRPQGHGYTRLVVDRPNPFFDVGTVLKGHEFHYSGPAPGPGSRQAVREMTACGVERGTGCGFGRDAVSLGNVWASYTHLHATATPEWAPALVRAAIQQRARASTSP
jgi:cobyrinic acid a,c-diamide synthase